MFARRKIFLPVNYPVNIYEARGSDSLSRVCVMSRDSAITTFASARFYLAFKWLCSFRAHPVFDCIRSFFHLHLGTPTIRRAITFRAPEWRTSLQYIRLRDVLALSPRLFLLPHLGSISFMSQFGNPVGIVKERKTRATSISQDEFSRRQNRLLSRTVSNTAQLLHSDL